MLLGFDKSHSQQIECIKSDTSPPSRTVSSAAVLSKKFDKTFEERGIEIDSGKNLIIK